MENNEDKYEYVVDKINDYRMGVVNCLNNSESPFPVIDFSQGRFGVTSIGLKGKQCLIISHLNENVKGFPKGENVSSNVIGIQFSNISEVTAFENWLEIIKASLVSNIAMGNLVPPPDDTNTTESEATGTTTDSNK